MGKTPTKFIVREMTTRDAAAVAVVEEASFSRPWSRESFWREAANENTLYLVALSEEKIIGFIGCWLLSGEAQITNVAVLPTHRSEGAATLLMTELIKRVKERGADSLTLEVRPSNETALKLYAKFGLKSVGRRPGYYQDGEDALIMWNTSL